jgi:hypothetical protein
MAKKAKKKTVDEIGKAVGRIRDELSSHNVTDDLKSLRGEVEKLARRVAALEVPGRGSSSSRSTAARKPAASRSTAAKKPAAKRSTAAKKPAAKRSTAAKKPAASRSRSTTTPSRSTSTRSSGSSS